MSKWELRYDKKVLQDIRSLDGSVKQQVVAAIRKTLKNPLPQREGGYGVELGNRHGLNLTGCLKIKLKKSGIRIIYTLERTEQGMTVVIVGMRADSEVYREAARRLKLI